MLQENVAWSVPEKDTPTLTVCPGGTENVLPGATDAVLVGRTPVVPDPDNGVLPAGTPPLPAEFARAARLRVICVSLSIETTLVPSGYALPELTYMPIAMLSVLLTFITVEPWMYVMFTST